MNENGIINKIIPLGQYAFFIELFLAMLIFMWFAKKRTYFYVRLVGLLALFGPLYFLDVPNIGFFDASYLIVLLCIIFCGLILYKEKPFAIVFSSVAAFSLQHLSWNFLGYIYDMIPNVSNMETPALITIYVIVFLVLYALALFIVLKLKIQIYYEKGQFLSFLFSSIIIFIVLILSQLVGYFDDWSALYRIYSVIAALLALIIQIGYPYLHHVIVEEKSLENEKKTLETLISMQARQEAISTETTDIINMKFHDLKNQLIMLKGLSDKEKDNSLLELEKNVDIYASITKTGNDVLDIIINQKGLICASKNIRFTYIIDGKSCQFISNTDLTSLFGNIIDNAIEASDKEEDAYRLIKMQVSSHNGFLSITEENYSHQKLVFKNGRPLSDKNDSAYHGFGLKSIDYIVNKYDGNFKIEQKDNLVLLSILIPLPKEKEA